MSTDKRARQKAARNAKREAEARRRRTRKRVRNGGIIIVLAGVVIGLVVLTTGGSSSPPPAAKKKSSTDATLQAAANKVAVKAGCPASTKTRVNTLTWTAAPAMTINPTDTYTATVKTTAGSFVITLLAKTAPNTVNNFVFLANQGYYKCVIFHRVIPGFMDQTGDPTGTGSGGPGYQFDNENLPTSYATGDVAMANSGANTNGSQFFVVATGGGAQLSADYSLFGKVTTGMNIVEKINRLGNSANNGTPPKVTERMLSVTIHQS